VENVGLALPAQERSQRLRVAVDESRIGQLLQLLVVAEDSLYLWQTVRIQRAQVSEPEHSPDVISSAKAQMRDDLKADGEVIKDLRKALISYGELRPLEVHGFRSRHRLQHDLERCRCDLDQFVEARRLQVEAWPDIRQPTLRDARQELGHRSVQAAQAARQVGARLLICLRSGPAE
jgi:hypothetical protein